MKLKRRIAVGLATVGVLSSLGTSIGVAYYEHQEIDTLNKQYKTLTEELKDTKKLNKEYESEISDLTDKVNEINTLISEKTN